MFSNLQYESTRYFFWESSREPVCLSLLEILNHFGFLPFENSDAKDEDEKAYSQNVAVSGLGQSS